VATGSAGVPPADLLSYRERRRPACRFAVAPGAQASRLPICCRTGSAGVPPAYLLSYRERRRPACRFAVVPGAQASRLQICSRTGSAGVPPAKLLSYRVRRRPACLTAAVPSGPGIGCFCQAGVPTFGLHRLSNRCRPFGARYRMFFVKQEFRPSVSTACLISAAPAGLGIGCFCQAGVPTFGLHRLPIRCRPFGATIICRRDACAPGIHHLQAGRLRTRYSSLAGGTPALPVFIICRRDACAPGVHHLQARRLRSRCSSSAGGTPAHPVATAISRGC